MQSELGDIDCFDAYLLTPLDYALGLKQLETGAAEARARRLNQAAITTPAVSLTDDQKLAIGVGGGFLFIIVLVLWRRKQSANW